MRCPFLRTCSPEQMTQVEGIAGGPRQRHKTLKSISCLAFPGISSCPVRPTPRLLLILSSLSLHSLLINALSLKEARGSCGFSQARALPDPEASGLSFLLALLGASLLWGRPSWSLAGINQFFRLQQELPGAVRAGPFPVGLILMLFKLLLLITIILEKVVTGIWGSLSWKWAFFATSLPAMHPFLWKRRQVIGKWYFGAHTPPSWKCYTFNNCQLISKKEGTTEIFSPLSYTENKLLL